VALPSTDAGKAIDLGSVHRSSLYSHDSDRKKGERVIHAGDRRPKKHLLAILRVNELIKMSHLPATQTMKRRCKIAPRKEPSTTDP
jgi:hypothetical protein